MEETLKNSTFHSAERGDPRNKVHRSVRLRNMWAAAGRTTGGGRGRRWGIFQLFREFIQRNDTVTTARRPHKFRRNGLFFYGDPGNRHFLISQKLNSPGRAIPARVKIFLRPRSPRVRFMPSEFPSPCRVNATTCMTLSLLAVARQCYF